MMGTLVKNIGSAPVSMSNWIDQWFGPDWLGVSGRPGVSASIPAVNVKETEDRFQLELAAPGMNKKDFSIDLEENVLTISAEHEHEKSAEEEGYMRKEFGRTSFKRSFQLPQNVVDAEKIKARYQDGVLMVEIPKKKEEVRKNRRIEIG